MKFYILVNNGAALNSSLMAVGFSFCLTCRCILSSFVLQSSRGGTLLKTLVLLAKLGCCQEVHFVIKYCHILYLWNDKKWFLTELSKRDSHLQSGDVTDGRTKISWRLRQTIIKLLNHLEHSSVNFRAASVNVEALRSRSKQITEMLECWPVDIYCAQDTRFRGKSVWRKWHGFREIKYFLTQIKDR